MIVFKPVWLGLCVVVLLSLLACNTTPTKPSLKAAGNRSGPTAVEHVELASQAIDRWRQHFKTADLQQAYFHYSQARKTFPHNAELQRYHYNSAYYLALAGVGEQVELQHVFNELNEWVKTQVNPPSKIRYAKIHDNESTAVEEIAALKPVIREQPYNAHSWFRLSLALEENKQSWVASFAARRAFELNDDVDYRYNYGESLVNIAYSTSACHYDDEAFLKKAAKYMAIASGKKEEAYYLDNIALNYLSLGLFPLAHREAKKAFMAEKTYWTSLRYAHSSELVGDYDAARIAGDYLLNELNLADGAQILARVSFQEQNLAEAAAYMQLYYEHTDDKALPFLILQWLYELNGYAADFKPLIKIDAPSEWYATIKSYFLRKPPLDDGALLVAAKDGCQRTEAYFYTAYRYWRKGEIAKASDHLGQVLTSPAKNYFEALWAKLILKHL